MSWLNKRSVGIWKLERKRWKTHEKHDRGGAVNPCQFLNRGTESELCDYHKRQGWPQDGFERPKSISGLLCDIYGLSCNTKVGSNSLKCHILVAFLWDWWVSTEGRQNTGVGTYSLVPLLIWLLPFLCHKCTLLTGRG